MRIRRKTESGKYEYGTANSFHPLGIGEVICYFNPNNCDLEYIENLEVQININDNGEIKKIWKPMSLAFADKDIIPDNYSSTFDIPHSKIEFEQGFNF